MAETRKERNIRNETQRRINAGDTSSYVQSQISSNPNTFTNVQPNQQSNQNTSNTYSPITANSVAGPSLEKKMDMAPPGIGYGAGLVDPNLAKYIVEGKNRNVGFGQPVGKPYSLQEAAALVQNQMQTGVGFGEDSKPLYENYSVLPTQDQNNQNADQGIVATTAANIANIDVNEVIKKIPGVALKGIYGGAMAIKALLDKAFKPELKDFSNPNFLAVMNAAFKTGKKKGGLNYDNYYEKYKNLIDDAFKESDSDPYRSFQFAMFDATENVEPGSGTQRITNPEGFYIDDGKSIMPQTTGGLENLANLDAQQYLQGENYNPELAKMIFNARATLDQNKGNQGGGGSGIMGTQMAQQTGTTDPGYDMSIYGSRIGQEGPFTADFVDQDGDGSDDRYQSGPGQGGSKAIPKENFIGGIGIDNMGIRGGVPSLTPTTIDYASMGPQYGGYVNQGISDPRFASYLQNLQMFPRRS